MLAMIRFPNDEQAEDLELHIVVDTREDFDCL